MFPEPGKLRARGGSHCSHYSVALRLRMDSQGLRAAALGSGGSSTGAAGTGRRPERGWSRVTEGRAAGGEVGGGRVRVSSV